MCKPGSKKVHKTNLYRTSDVLVAKEVLPKINMKGYKNRCRHITKVYTKRYEIKSSDDLYNVRIKSTHRGRKCPVCGKPIATGQQACSKACRMTLFDDSNIDVDMEYSTHVG